MAVDELAGAGGVREGEEICAEGLVDGMEMAADEGGVRRRERGAIELNLHGEKEGALRAGDEAAEIEGMGRGRVEDIGVHEKVEGVAGIAAGDGGAWKIVADLGAVLGIAEKGAEGLVDACLEAIRGAAFCLELIAGERTERGLRAVAEKSADGDEVVAGAEGLLEELEAVGDLVGGIDVEGRSIAAGERLKGDFAAIQGGAGAGVVKRAGRGICFQGHKWFPWFGVSFEPTALGMAAEVWDGTGLQGRCWSPMILFPGLERAWS